MQQESNRRTRSLMEFLDRSPVNFYAVHTAAALLESAGYQRLDARDEWHLEPDGKYFTVKNDSALFAFRVGTGAPHEGFRIIAAHSDSPCFRVKPAALMRGAGDVARLNVEVYGGPILYTWFDRPLSLAGRVIVRNGDDPLNPRHLLVRFDRPLLTIPHLAIHFNRNVNEGNRISAQKDMLPVIGFVKDGMTDVLPRLLAEEVGCEPADILDFDLSLFDTTPACLVGIDNEFITSGRLDDLSMVHAAVTALAETDTPCAQTRVAAIFDNEETGSGTKQGAASPVLANILRRVCSALGSDRQEDFIRAVEKSFMVSADNAHAFHPNYPEKYDPTNHPVPGGGPVIKINARCKYMTDADSAAVFASICREAGVPCQYFVNHSDVAGGSTLGNILTSQLPLRGVDMGEAIWAMHSVRETAAAIDHTYTIRAFARFFAL